MLSRLTLIPPVAALLLAGCGDKAPVLPDDPIDKAAACGVIAAGALREQAGVNGELSADAQGRIFHYALLAGSEGPAFDNDRAQQVFTRMPVLSEDTLKGKWQSLRPACAAAFPATSIPKPALPANRTDAQLQCLVMADFMRKALGNEGVAYGEAVLEYGQLVDTMDAKVSPALKRAGVGEGAPLQQKRKEALAAAAKLGPPPLVLAACKEQFAK